VEGHPASSVLLDLKRAVFNPTNGGAIESRLLIWLIFWALKIQDHAFLCMVRDVVAHAVTGVDSFEALLSIEYSENQFDSRHLDAVFLWEEYKRN